LWILKDSFIKESISKGHFVPELDHEWTEMKNTKTYKKDLASKLASAPRKWRLKRESSGVGNFNGWNVILWMEKKR